MVTFRRRRKRSASNSLIFAVKPLAVPASLTNRGATNNMPWGRGHAEDGVTAAAPVVATYILVVCVQVSANTGIVCIETTRTTIRIAVVVDQALF